MSLSSLPKHLFQSSPNLVNSIIDPHPTYPDVLSISSNEISADLGLEYLYSLESLGIQEEKDYGTIDKEFISKFHNAIQFIDGKYHIEIPWIPELVDQVPSNYRIALSTLRRVKNRLSNQGLDKAYTDVFKEQLRCGIIEIISVDPKEFDRYIWIPHRPVIKMADQVSTKIRPVFNCSLRTKGAPSLNQACYPGIDLLVPLLRLLLSFRTNKYVVVADISKAFLQIYLKLESDRNKFCFFWEEDGRLVTYRYATIIFGLAVSPFILGAVIRHHIKSKYSFDLVSRLLVNNLYVDNFIYTHSSPDVLRDIYSASVERMKEGGFNLCSWNTNHPDLKAQIKDCLLY